MGDVPSRSDVILGLATRHACLRAFNAELAKAFQPPEDCTALGLLSYTYCSVVEVFLAAGLEEVGDEVMKPKPALKNCALTSAGQEEAVFYLRAAGITDKEELQYEFERAHMRLLDGFVVRRSVEANG